MWLTSGSASGRKNSAPILLKKECYEEEVQPYRKTDYKPIIYISQLPCVRYYVVVKSSFKHTREECESKRAYVF